MVNSWSNFAGTGWTGSIIRGRIEPTVDLLDGVQVRVIQEGAGVGGARGLTPMGGCMYCYEQGTSNLCGVMGLGLAGADMLQRVFCFPITYAGVRVLSGSGTVGI